MSAEGERFKQNLRKDDVIELNFKERTKALINYHWRGMVTVITPFALFPILYFSPAEDLKAFKCFYVLCLMAVYWMFEAIPLAITALIPIVCFPVLGVLSTEETCSAFFKDTMLLFIAGIIVGLAIEYCNLHQRVALFFILVIGCSCKKLHLALMYIAMVLSMWASNSASCAMMCPIISGVLQELSSQQMAPMWRERNTKNSDTPYPSNVALAFFLGVAYASSIGGSATLIGTGTNLIFKGLYDARFPGNKDIDFIHFMGFSAVISIILTFLVYLWLEVFYMGMWRPKSTSALELTASPEASALARNIIKTKLNELGRMTMHEIQVTILFIVVILLLIFRKPGVFPGWGEYTLEVSMNSVPSVGGLICLFLLPVSYVFFKYCVCRKPDDEEQLGGLLSWSFVHQKMTWSLVLLLGGGFALAEGITKSGFAKLAGNALTVFGKFPEPILQLICMIFSMLFTAFAANMATANIILPVLLEIADAVNTHPGYLALPSTIALSMAYHFPVSTPTNAIVAGWAFIRTKDMVIAGIGPTLISLLVLFIFSQTWIFVIWPKWHH